MSAYVVPLPLLHQGKVRDIYDIDESRMLIITTDRISAFDVIFQEVIEGRGEILNTISNYWFDATQHIIPNHILSDELSEVLGEELTTLLGGRAQIVKKLTPLPIEAVVRGYIIGGGWKEYQATGSICGISLPKDLTLAQQFDTPLFTPATKALVGDHDENISFERVELLIGVELAQQVKRVSLELYSFARDYALQKGIIIADTKFEFGLDEHQQLVLMDEVLTPDSSRFWDKSVYQVGSSPESFDKQILRDYLETLDWDKSPPPPVLPNDIITKTKERYAQVVKFLMS